MPPSIRRVFDFLCVLGISSLCSAQINLGDAKAYAILGRLSVTNTGPTVINGDLGTGGTSSKVTGFYPSGIVNGNIVTGDATNTAFLDAMAAYTNIRATAPAIDLTGSDLGGMNLPPGTYAFSSTAQLTGTLTLNGTGSPDDEWYFQIGTALTTASASAVVFANGGNACRVYWAIGSSATLGTGTSFAGTIIAGDSVTFVTGSVLTGRAFGLSATVTLDSNIFIITKFDIFDTADYQYSFKFIIAKLDIFDITDYQHSFNRSSSLSRSSISSTLQTTSTRSTSSSRSSTSSALQTTSTRSSSSSRSSASSKLQTTSTRSTSSSRSLASSTSRTTSTRSTSSSRSSGSMCLCPTAILTSTSTPYLTPRAAPPAEQTCKTTLTFTSASILTSTVLTTTTLTVIATAPAEVVYVTSTSTFTVTKVETMTLDSNNITVLNCSVPSSSSSAIESSTTLPALNLTSQGKIFSNSTITARISSTSPTLVSPLQSDRGPGPQGTATGGVVTIVFPPFPTIPGPVPQGSETGDDSTFVFPRFPTGPDELSYSDLVPESTVSSVESTKITYPGDTSFPIATSSTSIKSQTIRTGYSIATASPSDATITVIVTTISTLTSCPYRATCTGQTSIWTGSEGPLPCSAHATCSCVLPGGVQTKDVVTIISTLTSCPHKEICSGQTSTWTGTKGPLPCAAASTCSCVLPGGTQTITNCPARATCTGQTTQWTGSEGPTICAAGVTCNWVLPSTTQMVSPVPTEQFSPEALQHTSLASGTVQTTAMNSDHGDTIPAGKPGANSYVLNTTSLPKTLTAGAANSRHIFSFLTYSMAMAVLALI
ncbi:hypothetical protein BKA65DRAFT_554960 [Rhexocercosporidium sp. MPI-PUGE-AT-0058]|nr:hypothetical protein BKA65DRAFT_554960 [Rhexocercosporidium sp. MPI-PUGE-AT-0058]